MIGKTLISCFFTLCAICLWAQDMTGEWTGTIQKIDGYKYTFRIEILDDFEMRQRAKEFEMKKKENVAAIVMHDRNGRREFFRLTGRRYFDNSIYLHEIASEKERNREMGMPFSRLQFILRHDHKGPYLDGHWQEYKTIRKYRKGRILLRRLNQGT